MCHRYTTVIPPRLDSLLTTPRKNWLTTLKYPSLSLGIYIDVHPRTGPCPPLVYKRLFILEYAYISDPGYTTGLILN